MCRQENCELIDDCIWQTVTPEKNLPLYLHINTTSRIVRTDKWNHWFSIYVDFVDTYEQRQSLEVGNENLHCSAEVKHQNQQFQETMDLKESRKSCS